MNEAVLDGFYTVDELNAAGKRLPGEKLLELVDLLVAYYRDTARTNGSEGLTT